MKISLPTLSCLIITGMNAPLTSYGVLERSHIKGLLFLDLRCSNFVADVYRVIAAKIHLNDIMSSIFNASPSLVGLRLSLPYKPREALTVGLPTKLPSTLQYLELVNHSRDVVIDLRSIRYWTDLRALSLVGLSSISPAAGPLRMADGRIVLVVNAADLSSDSSENEFVPLSVPATSVPSNPTSTSFQLFMGGTSLMSTQHLFRTLLERKV